MRNSFSLPNTHLYIHVFICKNMNCRESFCERMSCFNVEENKSFISYSKHTSLYQIILNGGGGCNKNSKIRMTTTLSWGKNRKTFSNECQFNI